MHTITEGEGEEMSEYAEKRVSSYNLVANGNFGTVLAELPKIVSGTDYQSEKELEDYFVHQLQELGYEYCPDIKTLDDLKKNLRRQLENLNNYRFTDSEWQWFYDNELTPPQSTIEFKSNLIHNDNAELLLKRDNGETKNIFLLKKKNIHHNRLQVINQFRVREGNINNRFDVTILVNGLPMVHVELKRRGVHLKEAFNQIKRYSGTGFTGAEGLFDYVQIFVISNGTLTRYYGNTARSNLFGSNEKRIKSYELTNVWADQKNRQFHSLEQFTNSFMLTRTLLNILCKYCVFNTSQELLVMRPYQIAATEKILNRIFTRRDKAGTTDAGGYIWHTTGSGKTLTSFKTAQLATDIYKDLSNTDDDSQRVLDKVLFVVDRQDLDEKTIKDFNRYKNDSVKPNASTQVLQQTLEDESQRIVVTTIQKLNNFVQANDQHPLYNKHVAIIFDECHRSQFGKMHRQITKKFKKYHLFGFTGTPIFAENRATNASDMRFQTTASLFGDCLHQYTIVEASEDKTVLPFKVDFHNTMTMKKGINDELVQGIDRKSALLSEARIDAIVDHILERYDRFTCPGHKVRSFNGTQRPFNSILCTESIDAAITYYRTFKKKNHNLKIAMIYSTVPDDATPDGLLAEENMDSLPTGNAYTALAEAINDYNAIFNSNFSLDRSGFSAYHANVSTRLENCQIDMLIVVNMFLTGFDAKTLNTLWVDKNLRYHGLIQAFSRTNRVYNSVKQCGYVQCYRDLVDEMDAALKLFGDKNASSIVIVAPYEELRQEYEERGKAVRALCEPGEFPIDEAGFVKNFGAFLRQTAKIEPLEEFVQDGPFFNEREMQDYQSVYFDLYDKYRGRPGSEEVPIEDDLLFEIELVRSVEIDLQYLLNLIKEKYQEGTKKVDVVDIVMKSVSSSFDLRPKEKLIRQFLEEYNYNGESDVLDEWTAHVASTLRREMEAYAREKNIDLTKLTTIVKKSLRERRVEREGTDLASVVPPKSLFSPDRKESINNLAHWLDTVVQVYGDLNPKIEAEPVAAEAVVEANPTPES